MKRNELAEIKAMDVKAVLARVKKVREEILESMMDKKMSKMKDLKTIYKKKKDIAQMMTVIRQKQLLEQLEVSNQSLEVSKEDNTKKGDTSELSSNA